MAALLATALAHYIKKWLRPLATRADLSRWPRRVVVAGMVLAPSLLGLLLILGLRVLFASFDLHTALIDVAMDLATVLVLVRFGVHVLERFAGPEQLDRAWELRLTFVLWAASPSRYSAGSAASNARSTASTCSPARPRSASGRCSRAWWSSSAS